MAIQNGQNGSSPGVEIDPETGDSKVIDEESYSHKRRLTAIHNAHDRVIDVRDAVEERLIQGAISEHHARRYYRRAIESLIMQLLPVVESDELPLQHDYSREVYIGTVDIDPPADVVEYARQNIERMPPGAEVPTSESAEIVGLRSVLEFPSPLRRQFSVVTMGGGDNYDRFSRTVEIELPREVLDSAVQVVAEALEDAKMGLNIGEGRPRNSVATSGGAYPWQTDTVLPHEVRDALETGDVTRKDLKQLLDEKQEHDTEGDDGS